MSIIDEIKEMRSKKDAPVDILGPEAQYDTRNEGKNKHFSILVGLLLSVQTRDEMTGKTMIKLRENNFDLQKALTMEESEIEKLISEVNYKTKKAQQIKNCAKTLAEKFDSKVPDNYKDLLTLPGVGPKIAHLVLQIGFQKVEGISVDTHVHRISNRLNWVQTKNPEQTKEELEKFVDKQYWGEINTLLVGFGQQICKVKPDCQRCSLLGRCPFEVAEKKPSSKGKTRKSKISF